MSYLKIILLSNALFSLLSGLLLIIGRNIIANWFGLHHSKVLWILGILLVIFSLSLFTQLKYLKPDVIFYIIVLDMLWVVASVVLIIIKPFHISTLGYQIIAGVAMIVLFFGISQAYGLSHIDNMNNQGIKRLLFERIINAAKKETWQAISDVRNYHQVAPNIDQVRIISGSGEGMVRQCSHKAESWTEVATLWKEGEEYAFEVNTAAEDYPYPLSYLKGNWKVKAISDAKTKITMSFDFRYNQKIFNVILHPFMKKRFSKISDELLDNWQRKLENN